jgi:hypothetical protein
MPVLLKASLPTVDQAHTHHQELLSMNQHMWHQVSGQYMRPGKLPRPVKRQNYHNANVTATEMMRENFVRQTLKSLQKHCA